MLYWLKTLIRLGWSLLFCQLFLDARSRDILKHYWLTLSINYLRTKNNVTVHSVFSINLWKFKSVTKVLTSTYMFYFHKLKKSNNDREPLRILGAIWTNFNTYFSKNESKNPCIYVIVSRSKINVMVLYPVTITGSRRITWYKEDIRI